MAVWSFVLAPGGDITSLVDIGSIKRHRRLHTELRPNVNRLDFRCRMDASTLQSLMANDVVELTVTRDAVPYFKGVLSPNYTAQIRDGQRYLAIIAEDFTIQKLGQTITTPQAWAGFAVCNPAAPASSLAHVIATAAGVTVASGAPTISATIPYVVALPDDKATWAKLLEDILFDHQHVYNFNEAGQLTLARAVNAGTIIPTATLTSAPGTANLRGELVITKSPEKYDDIRVIYDLVELKTGLVLFQDTTGGNDLTPASIPLAASGDAGGKDYYPLTSKIGEVYSAWNNPDGYDIWVATSAALDATYESGIVISRALTNYYRKASFAFRNTAGAEKKITKLRITGDAYVVASKNTARVSLASAKTLLEHQARYIFSDAAAQSLANSLAHYYRYADIKYSAKSALALAVGDYVTVSDPVYSGISTLCRVVGVLDSPATPGAIYEYELEGAADFETMTIVTEGESSPLIPTIGAQGPVGPAGPQGPVGRRTALLTLFKWAASAPTGTWPTGASTYTWATGAWTNPATLNGWTKAPGAGPAGQTLYAVNCLVSDEATTATTAATWPAAPTPYAVGAAGTNGTNGTNGLTPWYSYHNNPPTSAPSTPTGDGTAGGWSATLGAGAVWVSVKYTINRADAGTWSTPAVMSSISLLPTYSPKYLGPGRLSATGTAAFRRDTINANGTVTTGSNVTPNAGDWMYNYDTSAVATLSVFRWSGTAWETSTVTWEHWIAATEDIGRYIKGGSTQAVRDARTPANWTFLDTIIGNQAFFDRLATALIRSSNYQAGVQGMSIDLQNAVMQAENGKWHIDGTTGRIVAFDFVAYGIDFEEVDGGDYVAGLPDYGYGYATSPGGGALDGEDYVAGSFSPDRANDGGDFMGG